MGNFYVNYTLRGPSQQAVVSALKGRRACVTRQQDGCVLAFDEGSEDQSKSKIAALGECLSRDLACTVWAICNHDDDILRYLLYQDGALIDEYNSCPGYFEEDGEIEPAGGDAKALCAAFGAKEEDVAVVDRILRNSTSTGERYVFAFQQHEDLCKALGLSDWSVGTGYVSISRGEPPLGLTADDLLHAE
jgi:hypothetical protein